MHAYPENFLFAKQNGTIPVPVRVLTDAQREVLNDYIARRRQLAGVSENGGLHSSAA